MIGEESSSPASEVGYGRPPKSTRFRKGTSGNPKGRPRGRRSGIPHDHVLGQMVTIREEGRERKVTAAEAFLLHLTRQGLAGDSAATRASLEAIEKARAKRVPEDAITVIILKMIKTGIEIPLEALGIAMLKSPHDEQRVRWEINPWMVELALSRLRDRELSVDEQREVYRTTRTPHKVNWPKWWTEFG